LSFRFKTEFAVFIRKKNQEMDESWWVANLKALETKPQRLEALTKMNTVIGKETAAFASASWVA